MSIIFIIWGKLEISNTLYEHYKDQGYMKDENDMPEDDVSCFDAAYNENDFDFECDNSVESNYEE